MRFRAGARFAGYTIERQLGAGGMGVVYLARHPRLERLVALKVLNESFADDEKARARFEREAAMITALDHPNIVPIYDRNSPDDDVLWISMKFIEGGDAAGLLNASGGRIPVARAVRMIGDAAAALDHAHRYGILHRDVKPANLLVEQEDYERTLVTDFGIARSLDDTETGSRVSATVAYAAPERFSSNPVDHRADIYSLGCTLYKLLTGEAPYPRPDEAAIMAAHLYSPPPRPSERYPDLPAALDEVFATVLAKHPDDRYTDCTSMARAAHAALVAEPSGNTVTRRYVPAADEATITTPPGEPRTPPPADTPGSDPSGRGLGFYQPERRTPTHPEGIAAQQLPGGGPVTGPATGPERSAAQGITPESPRRLITRRRLLIGGAAAGVSAALAAAALAVSTRDGDQNSASEPAQSAKTPERLTLPSQVLALAFTPDGGTLIIGGKDNTARYFEVASGRELGNPLTGHSNSIRALAISADGALLATGSEDMTVRLWDAHTRQPLGSPLTAQTNAIRALAFSPDGSLLATASEDTTTQLWTVRSRQPAGAALTGHTGAVRGLAFHPDGATIATGSADTTVRLWSVKTRAALATLTGHNSQIRTVAYNPGGTLLASGGDDATIRLWADRAASGKPLSGHSEPILSLGFSPDGTLLASGSRDGTARLWHLGTREPIGNPLSGHTSPVHTLAFSPDGKVLATGSADATVRLWQVSELLR
ncbi:serine/threonine protein kinase [Nocardia yamanashiensis]|uniref:WD40 repeat domain-containing serine/threonine protein kinase n=1 Tax=Nocardia yamanashiensis TaxID=209247 RepID=UPI001E4C5FFC|nr:serine/threonine-protein kinase [Nocardia yamanashiensis]UGT39312.1 serine/threonine protein kinase [Nocardia yamanashiensis]